MDVRSILIAQQFEESWDDIHRLIGTMKRDLAKYAEKPDANATYIAIQKETIARVEKFVHATADLVDEQSEMLKATKGLNYKHKRLLEEHETLKAYARSKGLDLSLIPYMKIRDFNIHL